MTNLTDQQLKTLLTDAKTVAIVGASDKPGRASHEIMKFLMKQGYEVYPINPLEKQVLGVPTYDTLSELPIRPDIVDVFRRSDAAGEIVREAAGKGTNLIWLQEGVISDEGLKIAQCAETPFVMDRCIYKEYVRLGVMR
jgi:predicted CoA-binding protein